MKKICIAGDSWGVGVWPPPPPRPALSPSLMLHGGLAEFLSKNHIVINASAAGDSNSGAFSKVEYNLAHHGPFDMIFWFFTDPLRDLRPKFSPFYDEGVTFEKILNIQRTRTIKAFENFNKLDIPVYCMGGTVRLDLNLIKHYRNLIPFIPCITEYLEPKYEHPDIWQSDWMEHVGSQFSLECLDKFLENKRKQDKLLEFKRHFWPDGAHPNELGHFKIYEKACKILKL